MRISDWSSDVCSSDLVEWISAIDYNVDEGRHSRFFKAAQKIWPAIEAEKLVPAYCGIRPKIASESGNADFIISGPAEHGLEGLINLFGIESPGLTASLAIARRVGARSDERRVGKECVSTCRSRGWPCH